jgi:hypothetical protein
MRDRHVVRPPMERIAIVAMSPRRAGLVAVAAFALAGVLAFAWPGAGDAATNQCNDMIDNDGDGLIDRYRPSPVPGGDPTFDGADPGCLVGPASVENPPAVATTLKIRPMKIYMSKQPNRCNLYVKPALRGAQRIMRIDPEGATAKVKAEFTLKGISGAALGYRKTLKIDTRVGGMFVGLKHGRYRASTFYPGDRLRARSPVDTATKNVRCASSHPRKPV